MNNRSDVNPRHFCCSDSFNPAVKGSVNLYETFSKAEMPTAASGRKCLPWLTVSKAAFDNLYNIADGTAGGGFFYGKLNFKFLLNADNKHEH